MLAAIPSDTVEEWLRQGKGSQAMELYRREGAIGDDVNYLNTADAREMEVQRRAGRLLRPLISLQRCTPLLLSLALVLAGCNTSSSITSSSIEFPSAVATDAQGDVYVAVGDTGESGGDTRILKLSSSGRQLAAWKSRPINAMAVDRRGNVYVGDFTYHKGNMTGDVPADGRIVKYSPTGKVLTVWSVEALLPQVGYAVPEVTSLVVDFHGDLYVGVGYMSGERLYKLSPQGRVLQALILPVPDKAWELTIDSHGNIFDAAWSGEAEPSVVKLSPTAQLLTVFHERLSVRKEQSSTPLLRAASWTGVAVDARGEIYMTDAPNSYLEKFAPTGKRLWFLSGDSISHPGLLAVDRNGNVYVAQADANSVVKVSPEGKVLAVWG